MHASWRNRPNLTYNSAMASTAARVPRCRWQIIKPLQKSRSPFKILKKSLIALVVVAILFGIGFTIWRNRPISDVDHEFVIKSGSSLRSSVQQIADGGVPVSPILMELLARLSGQGAKLKAGTFVADAHITPNMLLSKIVHGEFAQFSLTLIEGSTFRQMRAVILQNPNLQHETAGWSDQDILAKVGADHTQAEGLFFPDTYLFPKGSSDMDVYKRTYNQLQAHLQVAWESRDTGYLPLKSPYEALILASLIEKETGKKEDRAMIGGVFANRLRRGMYLQTDPAVIYGMGDQYQGKIHKSDLLTDTPYNTYTRGGLPPTPIALVSMDSLLAAVNPAHTEALYFVSRGDGTSQFSMDLAAHNRAVNRYAK